MCAFAVKILIRIGKLEKNVGKGSDDGYDNVATNFFYSEKTFVPMAYYSKICKYRNKKTNLMNVFHHVDAIDWGWIGIINMSSHMTVCLKFSLLRSFVSLLKRISDPFFEFFLHHNKIYNVQNATR